MQAGFFCNRRKKVEVISVSNFWKAPNRDTNTNQDWLPWFCLSLTGGRHEQTITTWWNEGISCSRKPFSVEWRPFYDARGWMIQHACISKVIENMHFSACFYHLRAVLPKCAWQDVFLWNHRVERIFTEFFYANMKVVWIKHTICPHHTYIAWFSNVFNFILQKNSLFF